LNRKTCTVLSEINFEGIAIAVGIEYLSLNNDLEIDTVLDQAMALNNQGKAILVDVNIDYSKKNILTKGVIKVNLGRCPFREKVRFLSRSVKRHITG
jgi:acetolactate synthase-1/2/3 large subunit